MLWLILIVFVIGLTVIAFTPNRPYNYQDYLDEQREMREKRHATPRH